MGLLKTFLYLAVLLCLNGRAENPDLEKWNYNVLKKTADDKFDTLVVLYFWSDQDTLKPEFSARWDSLIAITMGTLQEFGNVEHITIHKEKRNNLWQLFNPDDSLMLKAFYRGEQVMNSHIVPGKADLLEELKQAKVYLEKRAPSRLMLR